MEITARSVRLEDDGYCTVLGFADDETDPTCCVILQIANVPSEQDVHLGQAGIHIELRGSSNLSGYDVIQDIDIGQNEVTILFKSALSQSSDRTIEIKLDPATTDKVVVANGIQIFKSRLSKSP